MTLINQFEHPAHILPKDQHRISKPKKLGKRRYGDDGSDEDRARQMPRPVAKITRNKKIRQPEVAGQKLSVSRIIETLDQESLQNLISNLVSEHPEIASTLLMISPQVTIDDSLQVLEQKLDRILENMPYRVDASSDYSFLRVKSLVEDFFQSLSDYILNYLPPVESDLSIPLTFLMKFLTKCFPRLPKFQAVEFRYYHGLTIDKLNTILDDILTQFLSEKKHNILLVINNNWLDDFRKISELNDNHFSSIYEHLKQEIDHYHNPEVDASGSAAAANSNRLMGLANLLNFSSDNSPLHGNTVGNVFDTI
ncbi:hypothetical protein OGAPHI_000356 [Ogataea philodendri]|uniref:Tethering factor for nuclear proteasome STS1 n=1 Tax=Ogataea philodendri TaxID=1378263 RepID=A0A9P8PGT1_9ASCO|nr:uncharacterized protein OGAPHI_000356 [Ogataea philodendri]KAH3671651.1 hypothetical protein OGAPHI_000356 [Ogataea philodendri]